jgi:hypothetical protein
MGLDSPTVFLRQNFLKESLKCTCNSHPFYHEQQNGQGENDRENDRRERINVSLGLFDAERAGFRNSGFSLLIVWAA